MWLFLRVALAAPLRLSATHAVPEVLPVTVPGRVEILIRGSVPAGESADLGDPADLRSELGDVPIDGVRAWRLWDLGGEWLLTAWMRVPGTSLRFTRDGDSWVSDVLSAAPLLPAAVGGCDATPRVPLVPLHGRDMLHEFPVTEFVPSLPRWSEGEPSDPSWDHVASLRRSLDPGDAHALYALGALHRDLGHAREAAYYFGVAVERGAPAAVTTLQRAGAELAAGDWEAARTAASDARGFLADDEPVREIEGVLALVTANPPPAGAGRALAAATARPQPSLLAGALLLSDGCATEAIPVLARATHDPGHSPMARLLLVDALLLGGEVRSAESAMAELSDQQVPPRWAALLRSRAMLLTLLNESPDAWPTMVPTLEALGRGDDGAAAESLFLLAQIGETLGDTRLTIDSLAALVDRHRGLVAGEPGRRLAAAWQSRVTLLLAEGRDLDALALHAGAWRPGLLAHLADPTPLHQLAEVDERYGLYGPALDLMQTSFELEGGRGLDDRGSVLAIARLYRLSGRPTEATESLDFLALRPSDPTLAAEVAMLRAGLHADAGEVEAARALYATVRKPAPLWAAARLSAAMLDAHSGGCAEALPVLATPPDPLPASISRAELADDHARCLDALGRHDEARAVTSAAIGALVDADARAFAVRAAGTSTGAGPADVWTRLQAEDGAQVALQARLSQTREKRAQVAAEATDGKPGAPPR